MISNHFIMLFSPSIFSLRIQQECTTFGTAHIVHCNSMYIDGIILEK